ncbi:MAG: WYL domain-containing protein [Actinobacteria bacterium]|nr:WYL domain-containing protein [Actinomycetota bacterium]
MTAADDAARMLTLVPWFLERPAATIDEAAQAFGVDRRTILADLDTIGYCGLPGLGGGDLFDIDVVGDRVVVRVAWVEEPLRLTAREALRLVLAGEAVAAALGEDLPALRSALDEVRAAAGIPEGVRVQLAEDGTHWLPPLRTAIADHRRVRLRYRSRGGTAPSPRQVDPWALQVSDGSWYAHGLDHRSGERRSFRLDRIAGLDVLDTPATPRPADLDPAPPRYEPGPGDIAVELVLAPDVRWVADNVRPDIVEELADGGRRVLLHTDALRWMQRIVLSAGPGVTVLRPRELRDAVRRAASAALERYTHPDEASSRPRRKPTT